MIGQHLNLLVMDSTSAIRLIGQCHAVLQSNDEGDRQTTWTASLKRGMLRMLSKTPSGRNQSITDPQATPPMISPSSSFGSTAAASPNDQALRSAGLSEQQDVSLNSWASLAGMAVLGTAVLGWAGLGLGWAVLCCAVLC